MFSDALLGSKVHESIEGSEPDTATIGTSVPMMPGPDQCSMLTSPTSSLTALGMEISTPDGLPAGNRWAAWVRASHC